MQSTLAWRTMHSQGRGLFSVLLKNLPDIDTRTVREAEFTCNSLIGFNFGDGHLHDEDMIAAVQREAAFEPGELVIVWVESQGWGSTVQHYKVIDAALGVIERGTWQVADAVARAAVAAQRPDPHPGHLVGAAPHSRRRSLAGMGRCTTKRCSREHRDGRGGRAEWPGRRGHPGSGGRAGHRARSRRRDRRRHPQQRGDHPGSGARPLLGDPPDGRRLPVSHRAGPGPLRALLAATRHRLCPPARRRRCRSAVSLRRGHRRRTRLRRLALAGAVRRAVGEVRRLVRGHHGAAAAGTAPSTDAGPVRRADRAARLSPRQVVSDTPRRVRCSEVLRRMPSGRCTTR